MNKKEVRETTPGVGNLIHFNNAGASLPDQRVLDAIITYLNKESTSGGYFVQFDLEPQIKDTYEQIAQLIHANPLEIGLTTSASDSQMKVLHAFPWKVGDVVLTSAIEYGNNYLNLLKIQRERGIEIKLIPSLENGDPDLKAFENMLTSEVKMVAVTHIPTSSGQIYPVLEIGKIVKDHPALYLVDACQSVGHIEVDVQEMHIDFLSATSRKYMRGPRGLGFVYVRQSCLELLNPVYINTECASWDSETEYTYQPIIEMFEGFEKPYALIMGLREAVAQINNYGVHNIQESILKLSSYLRTKLSEIEGIHIWDRGSKHCGIVTFTLNGHEPLDIKQGLRELGINVSVSMRFSSVLDMDKKGISEAVRVSLHYFNTIEEIDKLLDYIKAL